MKQNRSESPEATLANRVRNEGVVFLGVSCSVVETPVRGGAGIDLVLYEDGDTSGNPVAIATKRFPGVQLGPRETLVKDYSENEGMLEALVEARIVRDTGRVVPSGYVHLHIVEVL